MHAAMAKVNVLNQIKLKQMASEWKQNKTRDVPESEFAGYPVFFGIWFVWMNSFHFYHNRYDKATGKATLFLVKINKVAVFSQVLFSL